jgi:hypothetical protein
MFYPQDWQYSKPTPREIEQQKLRETESSMSTARGHHHDENAADHPIIRDA